MDFPWNDLAEGKLESPFMPPLYKDNYDIENSLSEWKDINEPMMRDSLELM